MNKKLISWFIWFLLIILWNYGYPGASPLEDVSVAVILSLIFIIVKKFYKKS